MGWVATLHRTAKSAKEPRVLLCTNSLLPFFSHSQNDGGYHVITGGFSTPPASPSDVCLAEQRPLCKVGKLLRSVPATTCRSGHALGSWFTSSHRLTHAGRTVWRGQRICRDRCSFANTFLRSSVLLLFALAWPAVTHIHTGPTFPGLTEGPTEPKTGVKTQEQHSRSYDQQRQAVECITPFFKHTTP